VRNLTLILTGMMFASSAVAAAGYSATLAQPIAQKTEFVANGNLFRCEGSSCILTSHPVDAESVQSCRALQRRVGTLTSYIADGKPFDAEKLAKCNSR